MKRKRKAVRKVGAKALSFTRADGSTSSTWDFALPGTKFDYAAAVGDGLKSSVVVPLLNWMMRAVPDAPVVVERLDAEQWKPAPAHGLPALLRRPNPYYSGRTLIQATVADLCFGEAFWIKNRNGMGELAEIYWAPRALMSPKWDDINAPGVFVTHYDYQVDGRTVRLDPNDVVHFRFGMDPSNPRRGFSSLAAVFREVYVDDQASNFTASILRNLGIIGLVFAPDGQGTIPPTKVLELKEYVQQNFTGDKKGSAMVFGSAMKAQVMQYNLQGFDVGPIRDVSEERLCAAVGVPASVVGFGTGLQQTKVGATMRENRQLAWYQAVMPMQGDLADGMQTSLLPEFQDNLNIFRVSFDTSKVFALWEDVGDRHKRVRDDVNGSLLTVAEGRRELGYTVDDTQHAYYLVPANVRAVEQLTDAGPPEPAQPAQGQPGGLPADTGVQNAA